MGFLKRLSRSGKDQMEEMSLTSSASRSSKQSSRSSGTYKSSPKSSAKKSDMAKEAVPPNVKIVNDFYDIFLNQEGYTAEDFLEFFESPEVPIIQEDVPATTAAVMAEMMVLFRRSFPDMNMRTSAIKEEKPGVVVTDDNIVSGTFTGAPFQPLPHLKLLEPNGRNVVLDPERIYVTLKNGKITKMEVIAMGNHTGPIGFYILAGGTV